MTLYIYVYILVILISTYALSQVVIPLFLTAALFLGPVVMASVNDVRIKLIMMPHYWAQSMRVSYCYVRKFIFKI